ncbi:MAG: hypothetical protein M1820_007594 [Bogoriella megaspora]|nr:MAG: hypothetical protein M1820_007594 [Bogoriella megaspora]
MNQHSEFNYDGVTKTALDKLFDNPFEDTEVNELYKTRDDFCKIPNISDFADSRALSRAALLAKNRELLTTPNRDYPNPKASRTNPNGDGAGAESSVALDGNDTGLLHKGVGVSQTEVRSSKADNKSLKGDLDENYQREAQNNDIVEKPASGTSSVVEGRREDVRLRRSGGTTSDNDKVDRKHNDAASPLGLSEDDRRLTKYENEALDLEQQGSLKSLTSGQLLLLLLCACGAMAQGWAQESIVGANLTWPVDMGLAEFDDSRRLQWLENGLVRFAWVNAAPYLAGSLIGAWISDPISYARGRRLTLLVAGLCSFVAPIGCAYSNYWYQLLIWRIFLGIGIGVKSSVVPVLEAEAFTPQLRGKLLVSWQGFVAAGIFLASGTNQLFRGQWRLQIGIPFIAAIPILCLSYAVPESPRWLIKRGRMVNGLKALRRLRQTPLQADRDLLIIDAQINLERRFYVNKRARRTKDSPSGDLESLEAGERDKTTDLSEVRKYFERIPRLFTIARCRRAVFASCAVMFSQPASGINLFAFLAPTLIKQSGIDDPSNVETLWFNFGQVLDLLR